MANNKPNPNNFAHPKDYSRALREWENNNKNGNEEWLNILEMEWFTLEQPWCASEFSGMTILVGSNDPHVGRAICDIEDFSNGEISNDEARAIAQHIVDLHNKNLKDKDHIQQLEADNKALREIAEERAQFINNGVEFNYIQLPTAPIDSANTVYDRCQLTTDGAIKELLKGESRDE